LSVEISLWFACPVVKKKRFNLTVLIQKSWLNWNENSNLKFDISIHMKKKKRNRTLNRIWRHVIYTYKEMSEERTTGFFSNKIVETFFKHTACYQLVGLNSVKNDPHTFSNRCMYSLHIKTQIVVATAQVSFYLSDKQRSKNPPSIIITKIHFETNSFKIQSLFLGYISITFT